ncbi:MAG: glycosyltransferase family 4 protein [Chloroflexota bacterium]|nr:glycosyltransferase family 4 protein [Chloroflexota bacterium]MDE3192507.1 glycosyltransferase family 4 protein [Chloroflexota bacterium]
MKVLFVKRGYAPIGGSESLCFHFATRLAARGHDVRVVCAWPSEREHAKWQLDQVGADVFDDHRVFMHRGVEVVQVKPRGGIFGLAADATTLVDLMRGDVLERYAADRDLIHNVGREYLDSSLDVAEELDIPIVLTPLAHPGQFHGGDSRADLARYRRASAITTMTGWERDWYVRHAIEPSRLVVTGMGANAMRSSDGPAFRAAHGIPADAPLVLYIGRKERYKGYIQLLDAAESVWRRHPDTRFVFIGIDGFYSTFIDDFARYRDDRIIDIECASDPVKASALDACDVFAMPSRHETFGLGYIEAWLHERPVIGGDIPPLREVIDHGVDGLLVRQRASEVAGAIVQLLDDPALRAAMGAAGRAKAAERWDWARVIDRVAGAYQLAMSGFEVSGSVALA